jgi:bacterioferritin
MKDPKTDQLGGEPTFDPKIIATHNHVEYTAGSDLRSMLQEDLVAERIAIDIYREIVAFLGNRDSTTRRMLEDILAQEEEHADELSDFLRGLAVASER